MNQPLGSRRGQSMIMYTFAAMMMFGALGLVVDVGWAYYRKIVLQTAADAAALAAGLQAQKTGGSSPSCGMHNVVCSSSEVECSPNMTSAGNNLENGCLWAQANGVNAGPRMRIAFRSGTGSAPTAPGVNSSYWVTARITERIPQLFSAVLGKTDMHVTAQATSALWQAVPSGCVFVRNPTAPAALRMTGTTNITTGCGVHVNSNDPAAITAVGGGTITTVGQARTQIVGNWSGSGTISPAPLTGSPVSDDPLAAMEPPTFGPCDTSVDLGSLETLTISPGVICGGINLKSQSTLTLEPGLYVVKGGITMGGQTTMTGSGVTLYIESGGVSMAGGATVRLSAPTTGDWQGILFFQDRNNTSPATLVGGTGQDMSGVLYFPSAHVSYTGGSSTVSTATTIVADTLELVGNSYISSAATTQYTGISNGTALVE